MAILTLTEALQHPEELHQQWSSLLQIAKKHEFVPTLLNYGLEHLSTFSRAEQRQIQAMAIQWRSRFQRVEEAAQCVQRVLQAHHIDAIWLKGVALAYDLYPQPWMRQMIDLDIWVDKQQIDRILDCFIAAGFQLDEQFTGNHLRSAEFAHHYTLHLPSPHPFDLEIHYDLIQSRRQMLREDESGWFREHTMSITSPIGSLRIFTPEANLLYLAYHDIIAHDMRDVSAFDEAHISLRRKYDIARLIEKYAIDWEIVDEQAKKLGWFFAVGQALQQVQRYFQISIPDIRLEAAAEPRTHLNGSEKKLLAKWQTFLHLPLNTKIAYLRHVLIPARRKLDWLYPNASQTLYGVLLTRHYATLISTLWKISRRS
jgi:hypothetical protein